MSNYEPTFDSFVASVGGARVDRRFGNLSHENADYIFEDRKVLIELKIIEDEFGNTAPFKEKEEALQLIMAQKFSAGQIIRGEREPSQFYTQRRLELYRAPLARIVKKANRQIRETKINLGLAEYRGLLICINDGFRQLGADIVMHLLCRVLLGSNSSINAIVYHTNHYVTIPDYHYAALPWVPAYADAEKDDLPDFVNWLGKEWFDYVEKQTGPAEDRFESPDFSIAGARPIL